VQLAVAVEIGKLVVDAVARFLVGNHVKLIELVLMFVKESRVEIGYSESREIRRLSRIVGDLKGAVRYAADICQAAGWIEHS
jgi:hypothetical protein